MTVKLLKYLPLLPAIIAVMLWGASFNSGRESWETSQRIGAVALSVTALALAVFALRKGLYDKLTYKDLGNCVLAFAGFILLTMSEVNEAFRAIGIVVLLGGIFRLQKGGQDETSDEVMIDATRTTQETGR